jgi:hypothetical protein
MSFKLKVGLNHKMGEPNDGSRGANVNVEMEIDANLAADPQKTRDRIRDLFRLARTALTEELNGVDGQHIPTEGHVNHAIGGPSSAAQVSLGHESIQSRAQPRPATQAQIKALFAICKQRRLNLNQVIHERFRRGKPEQLSIREAGQLIDDLESSS